MSNQTSFCWVRVLATNRPATTPEARLLVDGSTVQDLNGGRPPDWVSALQIGSVCNPQPGLGVWTVHPQHMGRVTAKTVIDFGPAFEDEGEAKGWITTAEGVDWDLEALDSVLMVCDLSRTTAPKPTCAEPEEGTDDTEGTPDAYRFKQEAWSDQYGQAHRSKRGVGELLLDDINALRCDKIDHDGTQRELDQLVLLQKLERPGREAEIRQQAQSLGHAIHPILAVADIDHAKFSSAAGKELIAWVADTVEPVVFLNKRRFMRARPVHLGEPELAPMFPQAGKRPDRLYPGHPSYPSGHATMAWVWAELLKRCHADPCASLAGVADAIGRNREIAGVHFESDTAAGKALASAIVKGMFSAKTNQHFDRFMDDLRALGLKV